MAESSSQNPSPTPDVSSSLNLPEPPNQSPEPAGAPATRRASTGSRSRKKSTSKRKTTKARTSRSVKIEREESKAQPEMKPPAEKPAAIEVDPERIDKVLEKVGNATHRFGCDFFGLEQDAGHTEDLFKFTDEERAEIAKPLATIAGRHARVAAVAQKADELMLALVLFDAITRNVVDARAAIAIATRELPIEPTTEERLGFQREARDVPVIGGRGEGGAGDAEVGAGSGEGVSA